MFRSILVPLDGSSWSEHAIPFALGLARRSSASVEFVRIVTTPPEGSAPLTKAQFDRHTEQEQTDSRQYLDDLAATLSQRWDVPITPTVLADSHDAADAIVAHAVSSAADLVVMSTHGRSGVMRLWLGSVADKVVRELHQPVLLIRPTQDAVDLLESIHEHVFDHMLIPLDGTPLAEVIVEPAIELAGALGARVTLLQAIEPLAVGFAPATAYISEEIFRDWQRASCEYLEQVAERFRAREIATDVEALPLPTAEAIGEAARQHGVDLIAMTSHGRGGAARLLLGSIANQVVHRFTTPVLLYAPRMEHQVEHGEPPVTEHVNA